MIYFFLFFYSAFRSACARQRPTTMAGDRCPIVKRNWFDISTYRRIFFSFLFLSSVGQFNYVQRYTGVCAQCRGRRRSTVGGWSARRRTTDARLEFLTGIEIHCARKRFYENGKKIVHKTNIMYVQRERRKKVACR